MTNAEEWFNIALRPRKPEGSLGRTAQDGHLDSHTASELDCEPDHFALRPQKRGGLLGTGTGGGGGGKGTKDSVKARPRIPPERDRRDCGPLPEQWKC